MIQKFTASQEVASKQAFLYKWEKVYQICKKKLGYAASPIGFIEWYEIKQVGPYHVIKNVLYALKKGSSWVNNARQQSTITFPFNPDKFSFNTMPYCEILTFIDLQNNKIIYADDRQDDNLLQPNEYLSEHVLKISKSQIANGHCIFVPYLRENHPQILRGKMIRSVLKMKGMFPWMKVGFNSQGAGSTVNHFHAQLINPQTLIGGQTFHFQTIQGTLMTKFQLQLQNNQKADIHLSSFEYLNAMYIKIHSLNHKISDDLIIDKIVHILESILELVFQMTIPHQLNIPDEHSVYLILRNYSLDTVRYGWVQFCGVVITTSQLQFSGITEKDIDKRYKRIGLPKDFLSGKINKI